MRRSRVAADHKRAGHAPLRVPGYLTEELVVPLINRGDLKDVALTREEHCAGPHADDREVVLGLPGILYPDREWSLVGLKPIRLDEGNDDKESGHGPDKHWSG